MSRIVEGALNEKNQFIIDILISKEGFADEISSVSEEYLRKHVFKGLIDTGACASTISSRVVRELELIPYGKNKMLSATEIKITNTYEIYMILLKSQIVGAALDDKNNIFPVSNLHGRSFGIVACELPAHDDDFDILVGMDILRECLLVVDRERFFLSF